MAHTVVVNKYQSPFDVDIMRPGPWGNPYSSDINSRAEHLVESTEEAIRLYDQWMRFRLFTAPDTPIDHPDHDLKDRILALDGLRLGCVCAPNPCHGDVLRKLVKELKELGDARYGVGYGAR